MYSLTGKDDSIPDKIYANINSDNISSVIIMKKLAIYSIVFVGLFCWQSPVYAANKVVSPILSLLLYSDEECQKLSTFYGDATDPGCVYPECYWHETITCDTSKRSHSFLTSGPASISWDDMAWGCQHICHGWVSINSFDQALSGDPASGFIMVLTPSVTPH